MAREPKLVDKVELEQFVEGLPAETARWFLLP